MNTNTTKTLISITDLAAVAGGKPSQDGDAVIVGYGPLGYYRLVPVMYYHREDERLGVEIEGKLLRQNASYRKALAAKLREAGLECYA